jgi:hypothetical protein
MYSRPLSDRFLHQVVDINVLISKNAFLLLSNPTSPFTFVRAQQRLELRNACANGELEGLRKKMIMVYLRVCSRI